MTQTFIDTRLNPTIQSKLSAWSRAKKDSGQAAPEFLLENFDTIVGDFPDYSVADKQRLLIQMLEEQSAYPGDAVHLDYLWLSPGVWGSGDEEVKYLVDALRGRGLIEMIRTTLSGTGDVCAITPDGWDYLDNWRTGPYDSSQAFVAMWFDPSTDSAWINGIKPAIENTGYMPYRVDNDLSNLGRIDAKIEAEIKQSRFLVADVTGGRQGVYYEAGYAMGLGLPVIWSVRDDCQEDMHFDTKQYRHIIWSTPERLAEELEASVIASIGANR